MDLLAIYHDIVELNLITQKDAARILGMRESNLKKLWCERGLECNKIGRPLKKIPDKLIESVINYRKKFDVGYKRCSQVMKRNGFETTQYELRTIYESFGLFTYEIEYKCEDKNRVNYLAKYANQIWHTDLHEFSEESVKKYLIAFIDDHSKFVIHHSILSDKSMISTSIALEEALSKVNSPPSKIVIDNGTEFVGSSFQEILKKKGIKDWRTIPYTPQQNGKIERFWGTLIRSSKKDQSLSCQINDLINEYNTQWEHNSFKIIYKKSLTPKEVWTSCCHWNSDLPDEIIYFEIKK